MSGHTPGPWRLENRRATIGPGINGRIATVVGAKGEEVVGTIHCAEELTLWNGAVQAPEMVGRPGTYVTGEPFPYSADARLIAAAPDLLAAGKQALEALRVSLRLALRPEDMVANANIVDLEAAIDKAEGR